MTGGMASDEEKSSLEKGINQIDSKQILSHGDVKKRFIHN